MSGKSSWQWPEASSCACLRLSFATQGRAGTACALLAYYKYVDQHAVMQVIDTSLDDVKIIEPRVFGDNRGFFLETWSEAAFSNAGLTVNFVQDNHSRSAQGVLRGMHYQIKHPQGKLVRCTAGEVFDVAVDMRKSSKQFGQWFGAVLSADNKRQLWVPPGFAHGFYVMSETADFQYKCSDIYAPDYERSLFWNDPAVGIEWPLVDGVETQLAAKDESAKLLSEADTFD